MNNAIWKEHGCGRFFGLLPSNVKKALKNSLLISLLPFIIHCGTRNSFSVLLPAGTPARIKILATVALCTTALYGCFLKYPAFGKYACILPSVPNIFLTRFRNHSHSARLLE